MPQERELWKTHWGMMLAMIGTEVGLGNIWRFPYLVGKYGGGVFLIPYIVLLLGAAVFAMIAEWVKEMTTLGEFVKKAGPVKKEARDKIQAKNPVR